MALAGTAAKIDHFFADAIQLTYNLLRSLILLFRSPIRGPLRLLVRNRSTVLPQVGPYTMLFVVLGAVMFLARSDEQTGALRSLVLHQKTPMELIVSAFVSVLLLDGVIRLLGRIYIRQKRRRPRFVLTTLYAFSAQATYLIILQIGALLWPGSS